MIKSEYTSFPGKQAIVGIDEAGRGPIAGPVVASAVILPKSFKLTNINDSKQISPKQRVLLFRKIKKTAVDYAITLVTPKKIDDINILEATFLAMHKSWKKLNTQGDFLIVDGPFLPSNSPNIDVDVPAKAIIKGDEKYFCIAAASILAKVYRDNLMINYSKKYPGYGFKSNKGYPTTQHKEAVKKLGPCPIHRKSFKPIKNLE